MQLRTIASKIAGLSLALVMAAGVLLINAPKVSADNTVDDFVNRCYKVALGRDADTDGFNFWKKEITEGRLVGSSVVHQFIFSAEYESQNTSDKQFVNDLYTMFMGRAADQSGYDFWCKRLSEGDSRESIFAGFANSEEFYKVCSDCGITAGYYTNEYPLDRVNNVNLFVERLYKVCLERIGDKGGQEYWVKGLLKGELQGVACAANYIRSKEYRDKDLSDVEYIMNLYRAMMGREYDKGGLSYWLSVLETGYSRDFVLEGFAYSPEFKGICERYGIVPGTFTTDKKIPLGNPKDYSEFDSNNRIIKDVFFDENGDLLYTSIFVYDSNGKATGYNSYDSKGNLISQTTYTYNSANRLVRLLTNNVDGSTNEVNYTLDKDNALYTSAVGRNTSTEGDKTIWTVEYDGLKIAKSTYDDGYSNSVTLYENGYPVDLKYYENGIVRSTGTFYPESEQQKDLTGYDENGKIEYIHHWSEDGKKTEYENYTNGVLTSTEITVFVDENHSHSESYDANGKLTGWSDTTEEDGKQTTKSYDEENRLRSIYYTDENARAKRLEYYDTDGKLGDVITYEYVGDKTIETTTHADGSVETNTY